MFFSLEEMRKTNRLTKTPSPLPTFSIDSILSVKMLREEELHRLNDLSDVSYENVPIHHYRDNHYRGKGKERHSSYPERPDVDSNVIDMKKTKDSEYFENGHIFASDGIKRYRSSRNVCYCENCYPIKLTHRSKVTSWDFSYTDTAQSSCHDECFFPDRRYIESRESFQPYFEDTISQKYRRNNESSEQRLSKRRRTIFTAGQLERLEFEFQQQQYIVGQERRYLARELGLNEIQVKVWFQNRRIKWRKFSPGHHIETVLIDPN